MIEANWTCIGSLRFLEAHTSIEMPSRESWFRFDNQWALLAVLGNGFYKLHVWLVDPRPEMLRLLALEVPGSGSETLGSGSEDVFYVSRDNGSSVSLHKTLIACIREVQKYVKAHDLSLYDQDFDASVSILVDRFNKRNPGEQLCFGQRAVV